jgi:hypothetical protein
LLWHIQKFLKEIITFEIHEVVAQRFALLALGRDADDAWKQDSAEVLKTAKNRAESHLSAARCVGRFVIAAINLCSRYSICSG